MSKNETHDKPASEKNVNAAEPSKIAPQVTRPPLDSQQWCSETLTMIPTGLASSSFECVRLVRKALPGVIIEVRMDSAFFSDEIVSTLTEQDIEYSVSVPFERFTELKRLIEKRKRWNSIDGSRDFFESRWKPKSWPWRCRFLFVRTESKKQQKDPVQLDLFEPYEYGMEFKVVVTNKNLQASGVLDYHDGRGSQEGVFAELKSHCHMDYVPVRTQLGNATYLLAGLFAFNLTRELQMQNRTPVRATTRNRATL